MIHRNRSDIQVFELNVYGHLFNHIENIISLKNDTNCFKYQCLKGPWAWTTGQGLTVGAGWVAQERVIREELGQL